MKARNVFFELSELKARLVAQQAAGPSAAGPSVAPVSELRVELWLNKHRVEQDDLSFQISLKGAFLNVQTHGLEEVPGTRLNDAVQKAAPAALHDRRVKTTTVMGGKVSGTLGLGTLPMANKAGLSAEGNASIKRTATTESEVAVNKSVPIVKPVAGSRWRVETPGNKILESKFLEHEDVLCAYVKQPKANRHRIVTRVVVSPADIVVTPIRRGKLKEPIFDLGQKGRDRMLAVVVASAMKEFSNSQLALKTKKSANIILSESEVEDG